MSSLTVNTDRDRLSVASSQHLPGDFPENGSPLTPNTSTQLSLAQAVHARRSEYTTPRTIRIKVGTWNVAAFKGTERDLGGWFVDSKGISHTLSGDTDARPSNEQPEGVEDVGDQEARTSNKSSTLPKNDYGSIPGGEDVDIYALGLQEVVDINSAVEALRPFSDVSASNKFKAALEESLPVGYKLVAEQQLIGLLLLIYASPSVAPDVHSVSTTSVGTGLMGYMGNKGAVTARIVLGETTRLVFINSHLSAGANKPDLERRNWDAAQIISRTRFDPITDGLGIVQEQGERIGNEDFAFWFGDLNYRLEGVPGDDVRKLFMLHTCDEYHAGDKSEKKIRNELSILEKSQAPSDADKPSHQPQEPELEEGDDPASLQTTINSLLPHDELRQAQKSGKAFQEGWKEGEITFLPTYKYDVGTVGVFDTTEKRRGPSWCDRILFRTRKHRLAYEETLLEAAAAKKKDAQMHLQGLDAAAESENTMFEYDPDTDGDDEYDETEEDETTPNTPPSIDEDEDLTLEYYTSHQRVLSADHKPLNALFKLRYDATDKDRKSQIQQEVAKELDKAENEGRPVVTIIVDGTTHGDDPDFSGISFGHVRYDEPKTRSVTIANTGRVTAYFGFVNHPQHSDSATSIDAQKWLSINFDLPSEKSRERKGKIDEDEWDHNIDKIFKLEPGETANVDLLSFVKDKELLKRFNDGEVMEDILILRIKGGRDHFLPVRGTWSASVHGRTLDRLIRIPEGGVRALQNQHPAGKTSQDPTDNSQAVMWSAPRELFRLIEAIESLIERITAEWSMLGMAEGKPPWITFAGWPFVSESWTLEADVRQALRVDVNEALDTDGDLNDVLAPSLPPLHRLEVLAEALLDFLQNLEDGIVTKDMWSELESKVFPKSRPQNSRDDMKAGVLEILSISQPHSISFVLLTSMLARTSQEIALTYAVPFNKASASPTRVSHDLPASPKVKIRRKTLDQNPVLASKQLMLANIAAVFADVLIRVAENERWAATEPHRRELIDLFLDGNIG